MRKIKRIFTADTKMLTLGLGAAVWLAAGYCQAAANTTPPETHSDRPVEGGIEPFLGKPRFDVQRVFWGIRMPNIVVTTEGTVLATWGLRRGYRVRRSEDGGKTWGEKIRVADGGHAGGVTVDETNGNIFVFVQSGGLPTEKPQTSIGKYKVYRSTNDGKTWKHVKIKIRPDKNGYVPAMHMAEHGITLRHGKHKGRLLRPARVYNANRGYNTSIYSDDGGTIWHSSSPFPEIGTGEGSIAELSDGTIYYNSRRHWAPKGKNAKRRWEAWSHDGGETWQDAAINETLPDGCQNNDYGAMGGLTRLPVKGKDILIFGNIIDDGKPRNNGYVWASFDGARTWPVKRQVDPDRFAYSSIAAGCPGTPSEGWIYVMYENGPGAKVARFNLTWLIQGELTGDGEIPSWLDD
ncbi:MAG: sialidase family protein [Verrucomicrobiota bacterium]